MKPEELIIKTKNELSKEEQEATEEIIKNVYKELEKRMKNDGCMSVDIRDWIECYSYKIQAKILDNVIKCLKENGYYVVNSDVYLDYASYKKERKFNRIFLLIFLFLLVNVTFLTIYCFGPTIYNICDR